MKKALFTTLTLSVFNGMWAQTNDTISENLDEIIIDTTKYSH